MYALLATLLISTAGCRTAQPFRAGPGTSPKPAPAARAADLPLFGPAPLVARAQSSAPPRDADDDDAEDDAPRPPSDVAVLGSDRPSRSPVLNREGPFGVRGDMPTDGGDLTPEPDEEPDNENGDGFAQPDLLMKALGYEAPSTRVYGWVEGAVLFNPAGPRNHQNLPNTPSDLANRWQFPQVYLAIERAMKNVDTIDYGYRFDNLFGTDFVLFNDVRKLDRPFLPNGYGDTPTQFYVDLHLPILTAGGLDLRFGQFISLAGYESAFAPGRPLRSTGLLFNYSHPFTNMGVLTTLNVTDRLQVFNAPINGWDRLLDVRNQWGYMGGINWDSRDERTNLTLTYYAGPNQISRSESRVPLGLLANVAYPRRFDRGQETTLVSAVLSHTWDPRWTTVFEFDDGAETGIPIFSNDPRLRRDSSWYGGGLWVLRNFGDRWTGVWRASSFRDAGGVRTGFNDTYFESALGLVYKPVPWFWVRPEIDYDGAVGAPPFETRSGRTNNELFFGFDVLFLF